MKSSNLYQLQQEIPYRWKVQSTRSWGCDCVAYIDARQVMEVLDEVAGSANWSDKYISVGSTIYCELSIRIDGEWVVKSDAGSQSNFEAEKGQASDAFKRAAVKWGIGRFLYSLPSVRLKAVENGTDDRNKPRYAPADDQGRKIRDITAFIQANRAPSVPEAEATPAQRETIKELCQKVGWTSEQLQGYLSTSQSSWKYLTKEQASRLLSELEDMPAKPEPSIPSPPPSTAPAAESARKQESPKPESTAAQKDKIKNLCQGLGWSSEQLKSFLRENQCSWKHMTLSQASKLITNLQRKTKPKYRAAVRK